MNNYFLVFSNGEKIGDGIIKLALLHEIKRRFKDHKIIWVANGSTVYANKLEFISKKYIYKVIDKANLNPFFWKKKSNSEFLNNSKFEYIFDTQKAVPRSIALKRLEYKYFISSSAKGILSSSKKNFKSNKNNYYLDELINLLNSVKEKNIDKQFRIPISFNIEKELTNIFKKNLKYIGIAPGAGEKNKIWPIENFIEIARYYENNSYKIVWFLGPEELEIKKKIKNIFPNSLYPEEIVRGYSSIEIIIASTKYLSVALSNDSGVSHILSSKYCPLIKLFGPRDSFKFTPKDKLLKTISSTDYKSNNIKSIPVKRVINEINNLIN